jgi:hypothetical protein
MRAQPSKKHLVEDQGPKSMDQAQLVLNKRKILNPLKRLGSSSDLHQNKQQCLWYSSWAKGILESAPTTEPEEDAPVTFLTLHLRVHLDLGRYWHLACDQLRDGGPKPLAFTLLDWANSVRYETCSPTKEVERALPTSLSSGSSTTALSGPTLHSKKTLA